jgi:hypothetical protein
LVSNGGSADKRQPPLLNAALNPRDWRWARHQ